MRHQGMVAGFSFPIVQVPYDPDAPAAGRRTATAKRCANCVGPLPKFKKKFCCQECLDAAYARKAERGTSHEGVEIMRCQDIAYAVDLPGLSAADVARALRVLRLQA